MSWNDFFAREDIKKELLKTKQFREEQREIFEDSFGIFPAEENTYKAFDLTQFDKIKVVLIGMDPYHGEVKGKPQAQGLCFSVPDGFPYPPSLKNIFKELCNDIQCEKPKSGNLTKWGENGVLLLNASLSVLQGKPNSHKKIWKNFSKEVIKYISDNKDFVIFIAWGNDALNMLKGVDTTKHTILSAKHPSPLSANKGGFFGCKHFSKCNDILQRKNINPVDWTL